MQYPAALREITAGRKSSHWIWFIFPQLALHGHSDAAIFYGLKSLPEAVLFLNDPVLGTRLIEITNAALIWLRTGKTNLNRLMGSSIDAQKLLSCATLFYFASKGTEHEALFEELLQKCQEQLNTTDRKTEEFCVKSICVLEENNVVT